MVSQYNNIVMSKFRTEKCRMINTRFWEDNYIQNLLPDEKLLFLYFITTPKSNIAGIYECSIKTISFHTGFDRENLENILKRFEGKIHYIDGWIYIRNFLRHQNTESPTIKEGIKILMDKVPTKIKEKMIEIDDNYKDSRKENFTLFTVEEVINKKKEETKNNQKVEDDIIDIGEFYKEKIKPEAKITDSAKSKIRIRLKTYERDELMKAILNFSRNEWRMKNNTKYPMAWFFNSDDQIEKWLLLDDK